MSEIEHGRRAYDKGLCHCSICQAANTAHVAAVRARRRARMAAHPAPEDDPGHGTQGGWDAGCRCEACSLVRVVRWWDEGGPRPHVWREAVTEVYREARFAWERRRESGLSAAGRVAGADYGTACYQLSDEEYRRAFPPPRFRDFLIGMSERQTAA